MSGVVKNYILAATNELFKYKAEVYPKPRGSINTPKGRAAALNKYFTRSKAISNSDVIKILFSYRENSFFNFQSQDQRKPIITKKRRRADNGEDYLV